LYKELKSLRQKKKSKLVPPPLLQAIHRILEQESKPIESFLSVLSSSKSENILSSDLLASIKAFDPSFDKENLEKVFSFIKSDSNDKISIQKLTDYYESFDFSLFASEKKEQKVLNLFKHLNLRMQLHRINKENLLEALQGSAGSSLKEVNEQEIIYLFTNSPFDFTRKQASALVNFLLENEAKVEYLKFIEKFYTFIQDWQVFTANDEQRFDRVLLSFVYEHKKALEDFCLAADKERRGVISTTKFFEFIESHKVAMENRLKDYLVVLFYSHNMELDLVPYKQFIQAYTAQDDPADDPKTGMVQKFMEKIASALLNAAKGPREVFPFDKNGLIMSDDFFAALKTVGIDDFSFEHSSILIEALQCERETRFPCVFIDELEDILETYGVPVKDKFEFSDVFSEGETFEEPTEGHVQKISLLDSAQLDLMPTPEPNE
jgi:Ca2+-binding EF-hand superfamily protein